MESRVYFVRLGLTRKTWAERRKLRAAGGVTADCVSEVRAQLS